MKAQGYKRESPYNIEGLVGDTAFAKCECCGADGVIVTFELGSNKYMDGYAGDCPSCGESVFVKHFNQTQHSKEKE